MNIHFNSGAVIDADTVAAAGDEIDVPDALAEALIAQGIAYSLEAATVVPPDTAIAELVDSDGTLAANSDAKIPSQKAVKTYVAAQISPKAIDSAVVHNTGNETIAGVKTFSSMPSIATHTPSAANDTGVVGQVAWDASYVYVCVATNTWKRAAIATW